ncbi:MAG: Lin1244/Lin1753 domain-containing protein [Bacteroidota bacterium]
MAKDTFYFSHDYNARNDSKIKKLLSKHGYPGYGMFWAIIEDLYNNANALPTDYDSIAFDLRTTSEVIKSLINDFDLFVIDADHFGSLSVERRLNERNDKSVKARESALNRWNKIKADANALRTQSECNAIKDSIGKESKVKDSSNFAETSSADTKSVDANFQKKEEAFTDNPVKAKPKKEKRVETETKQPSVYTECMDIYCRFIKFNNGVPVINKLTGKSLKEIIAHLKTASIDKGEGQDKEIVETFYGILKGYKRWQPFHQGQTKLNQINSNLQDIILAVNNKNPNQNGKPTSLYQQSSVNPFH